MFYKEKNYINDNIYRVREEKMKKGNVTRFKRGISQYNHRGGDGRNVSYGNECPGLPDCYYP